MCSKQIYIYLYRFDIMKDNLWQKHLTQFLSSKKIQYPLFN